MLRTTQPQNPPNCFTNFIAVGSNPLFWAKNGPNWNNLYFFEAIEKGFCTIHKEGFESPFETLSHYSPIESSPNDT